MKDWSKVLNIFWVFP